MTPQDIIKKINQLSAKRDRQKGQLDLTINELAYWEIELDKVKKGK